jgi:cytoplasmic iron level regulating protein YaaA (DUF328/UPF0246 family)
MLFLLSPAKTLDLQSKIPAAVARRATAPEHGEAAAALIDNLRRLSVPDVAALMDLSNDLATLNVDRYRQWQPQHDATTSRPAVLTFAGDVYDGLDAGSLNLASMDWAQRHLAILSGLYGCLRPLDLIQAHRLEMGTALQNPAGRDLYSYWADRVSQSLHARAQQEGHKLVINLASQEYARAALRPSLGLPVIHIRFEEGRAGRFSVISFFAKRARGLMARWAIEHRVRKPTALQAFDSEGYAFAPEASGNETWVYRRTIPT